MSRSQKLVLLAYTIHPKETTMLTAKQRAYDQALSMTEAEASEIKGAPRHPLLPQGGLDMRLKQH